jgi:hypothetical protein
MKRKRSSSSSNSSSSSSVAPREGTRDNSNSSSSSNSNSSSSSVHEHKHEWGVGDIASEKVFYEELARALSRYGNLYDLGYQVPHRSKHSSVVPAKNLRYLDESNIVQQTRWNTGRVQKLALQLFRDCEQAERAFQALEPGARQNTCSEVSRAGYRFAARKLCDSVANNTKLYDLARKQKKRRHRLDAAGAAQPPGVLGLPINLEVDGVVPWKWALELHQWEAHHDWCLLSGVYIHGLDLKRIRQDPALLLGDFHGISDTRLKARVSSLLKVIPLKAHLPDMSLPSKEPMLHTEAKVSKKQKVAISRDLDEKSGLPSQESTLNMDTTLSRKRKLGISKDSNETSDAENQRHSEKTKRASSADFTEQKLGISKDTNEKSDVKNQRHSEKTKRADNADLTAKKKNMKATHDTPQQVHMSSGKRHATTSAGNASGGKKDPVKPAKPKSGQGMPADSSSGKKAKQRTSPKLDPLTVIDPAALLLPLKDTMKRMRRLPEWAEDKDEETVLKKVYVQLCVPVLTSPSLLHKCLLLLLLLPILL